MQRGERKTLVREPMLIALDAFSRCIPADFCCSLHINSNGTVTGIGQERAAVVSIQGQSLEGWVCLLVPWVEDSRWSHFPQCQVSRSCLCPFVSTLGKGGWKESCAVCANVTQLLMSVPTGSAPAAPDCRVDATFEVCRNPWPREEARNNGMPQITHCPFFDCHNLTVWAAHRDHCMEQKGPAGSTVSLSGLFTVLNDLCVMSFRCSTLGKLLFLWESKFSHPSHRYGKNNAHIHKVVLRTKRQWIKNYSIVPWMEYSHSSKGQL